MALSRKSLKAMGLTDEQIESVIEMHVDTMNERNSRISTLEGELEELKKAQGDVDRYKSELEEAKKTIAENATYKEQYENTKAEYDKYKTEAETKAVKDASDKAFTKLLRDNGYTEKGASKIVKYGGFDVELNKDGSIKNADKLLESVNAEWPEFKSTERVEGAKTEKPPANTGGKAITKEQILDIKNTADRQKAIAENPALFGI